MESLLGSVIVRVPRLRSAQRCIRRGPPRRRHRRRRGHRRSDRDRPCDQWRRRRGGVPPDLHPQRRDIDGRRGGDRRRCRRRAPGRPPLRQRPAAGRPPGPELRAPGGAGDRNPGGRRRHAGLRQRPVAGPRHLAARPSGQRHRGQCHPGELRGGTGRELCAAPNRFGPAGGVRNQQAPGRLHRSGGSDARLPDPAGPPGPAYHQRSAVHGSGGRPFPLRLQRSDPGPAGGGAVRRHADQPQPGPGRGRPRRLRAEPGHRGERRQVQPRLDGRTGGRGPALLPRVARRGAGCGRAAHRRPASSRTSPSRCPSPARGR